MFACWFVLVLLFSQVLMDGLNGPWLSLKEQTNEKTNKRINKQMNMRKMTG